ncbi:MAG TPA: hypothetical protein VNZ58_11540 [Thermomicrobiales bacterium]|nr:hypothetical protein [Thermomicrobiales bacterium]
MKYLWTMLGVLALVASTLSGSIAAAAQATPESGTVDAETRATLAAIVPDANDLPVGYDFVGETFLTAEDLKGDDAAALSDAGFVTMYVSVYANTREHTRIRSYASAWTNADAASAGNDLLNATDEGLTTGSSEIGDEPRETASGTYKSGSTTMSVEAVSFRHDAMLLGTAVETDDGSEPDADLAKDIAGVMLDRADTLADGQSPKNIDLSLPGRTLSFQGEGQMLQAGFLGPKDVEGIYDTQGSVLSKLESSWVETVAVGEGSDTATITVGLTTFGKADDASNAVKQSADIFPPLTDQKSVNDASVDGADSVAAYTYSSSSDERDAMNSYRVIFSVDTDLVVIDVQGAPSSDAAKTVATDLAKAQLGCATGGACEVPDLSALTK